MKRITHPLEALFSVVGLETRCDFTWWACKFSKFRSHWCLKIRWHQLKRQHPFTLIYFTMDIDFAAYICLSPDWISARSVNDRISSSKLTDLPQTKRSHALCVSTVMAEKNWCRKPQVLNFYHCFAHALWPIWAFCIWNILTKNRCVTFSALSRNTRCIMRGICCDTFFDFIFIVPQIWAQNCRKCLCNLNWYITFVGSASELECVRQ